MQKHRFTPSPAMVVSLIALFIALGGTSYAAIASLPKNSVGTKQIKDGAVTAAKISSSALGPSKVVGAKGAPVYENGWAPPDASVERVSFYKDPWGIVHLQGSAYRSAGPDTDTIFTLPAGYRPAGTLWTTAYGDGGSAAYIEIRSDGEVSEAFAGQDFVGLTGISFRP